MSYIPKTYCVHFSEDDLYFSDGTYGRMSKEIVPVPEAGKFLLKSDGIYEIDTAYLSTLEGWWDIYLSPVESQCEDGDAILIMNRDKIFKCHKNRYEYGFKKITMHSLMVAIDELNQKVEQMKEKLDQVNTA